MATSASPCVRRDTIPRFTTERGWFVNDIAVRGNKLAVCGYNYMIDTQSCIDLFTLNDPDSSSRLMTQLFTKLFYHPRWHYACVSFLDDSRIVTVGYDLVHVYHIEADDSEPSHTVNLLHDRIAKCVTVREGEIFISFSSNKVIVFDFTLNKIKTITLKGLEGLVRHDYPVDITVYGNNLFISTGIWSRAIRYNMEGKIVHEYKTPGYFHACSITVSGLVYILWDFRHVVAYSLSDSQQLMSFDVDESKRIRIVDISRLLAVAKFTGEVREYSMPPDILTLLHESLKHVFAEMTRSDSENLANFFMFPLTHVKAIINSPSHSKDLLVELENKGIVKSALTDELCEKLGALNILTGRSEESESFLSILSSIFLEQVKGTRPYRWLFQGRNRIQRVKEEEGEGSKSSIDRPSSTLLKRKLTVEEGEDSKSSIRRRSPTFHWQEEEGEDSKSSIRRHLPTFFWQEEDWKPPDTMKITSSISAKGGLLQIPNTGIKLVFPPKAVSEEHNIQVKIVPPSLLNEPATTFSSNSSVVLELLPNGLQLKREVSLTLSHCLTFINEEEAKAKVYVSHHEEGQRPCWEERPLSPYIFHRSKCTVRLLSFCWVKIVIDDKEVEAKKIVVFATKDILQDKKTAKLEVGYYDRVVPNILDLNPDIKPEKKLKLNFLKEGKKPLTISFNGTDPSNTWDIEQDEPKKEISWQSIAGSEDRLVSFVLHRKQTNDSFCNVSAQQGNSDPIIFLLKLEVNLTRGEIADSTVPDYILQYLAKKLCQEWQSLARYLDITDADLDNLKEDNHRCHQDVKYFMLRLWSKRNGTGATYRVLATALEMASRKDLQQYVERQVTMQSRYEPTQDSATLHESTHHHGWFRGWLNWLK